MPTYKKRRSQIEQELNDLRKFITFTNHFKRVERLIWYKGVERRECDGEHTFQVAIVAWFLNERGRLKLDAFKLLMYALVHDLVETYAGDTPAFVRNGNGATTPCREEKRRREEASMTRIAKEWGTIVPSLVRHIKAYEERSDEESNFVYALDKLIAELNIAEDDGRSNHILGVSLETADLYKRPRIASHPYILALYDAHFRHVLVHKDRYYAKTEDPRAPT